MWKNDFFYLFVEFCCVEKVGYFKSCGKLFIFPCFCCKIIIRYFCRWFYGKRNFVEHFLDIVKKDLSEITFETWFKESKLFDIENDKIKFLVPDILYKKHLRENYNTLFEETFNEIQDQTLN
jgi:hypothetical protein